jgi:hypothetical protein
MSRATHARVFGCSKHDDLAALPWKSDEPLFGWDPAGLSCDGASADCQCELVAIARLRAGEWEVLDSPLTADGVLETPGGWRPLRDPHTRPHRRCRQRYDCELHWVESRLRALPLG